MMLALRPRQASGKPSQRKANYRNDKELETCGYRHKRLNFVAAVKLAKLTDT